jgi:hypothetical protein
MRLRGPLAALLVPAMAAQAAPSLPVKVGDCARTRIATVGVRLVDAGTGQPIAGSGSTVRFANGLIQISYDRVPAIAASRPGDPALVCLVKLPRNCPPGDNRGKFYTATNLRTVKSWTLPDSQHMCGGA